MSLIEELAQKATSGENASADKLPMGAELHEKTAACETSEALFDTVVSERFGENLGEKSIVEVGSEAARIGAMKAAINDGDLRRELTKGQAKRLRNDTAADIIDSKVKIHRNKEAAEQTLYKRYEYVFSMLGITKPLPSFMCVVVLAIYAVLATVLTLTLGTVFIIVNFTVDGVRGIFGRLNGLLSELSGAAKGFSFAAVFVLLAGVVAAVVVLLLKYVIKF